MASFVHRWGPPPGHLTQLQQQHQLLLDQATIISTGLMFGTCLFTMSDIGGQNSGHILMLFVGSFVVFHLAQFNHFMELGVPVVGIYFLAGLVATINPWNVFGSHRQSMVILFFSFLSSSLSPSIWEPRRGRNRPNLRADIERNLPPLVKVNLDLSQIQEDTRLAVGPSSTIPYSSATSSEDTSIALSEGYGQNSPRPERLDMLFILSDRDSHRGFLTADRSLFQGDRGDNIPIMDGTDLRASDASSQSISDQTSVS